MAEKKAQQKTENIEREYTIPLRSKWRLVPRYKKTNKAVKTVKEFLARHMKIRDRDLNKVRIDKFLNEVLWSRGIKNPPAKIKVKATKETDTGIVRAELSDIPEKLKFKKARLEKIDNKAVEAAEKKKGTMQKAKEAMQGGGQQAGSSETSTEQQSQEETQEQSEEKKQKEEEKQAAVAESTQKMEKQLAKQQKHQTKGKEEKKQPRRKTLER